jgi:hypothetical protein
MSDSNPIAVLERTSLIVYEADVFNCSPHVLLQDVRKANFRRGTRRSGASAIARG